MIRRLAERDAALLLRCLIAFVFVVPALCWPLAVWPSTLGLALTGVWLAALAYLGTRWHSRRRGRKPRKFA
jgi:hypothetical protein